MTGPRRERCLIGLATLGLLVALGAAAYGEPAAGPRTPPRMHEVKAGETLTAVARKYSVSVGALVKANRLSGPDSVLKVGRRLVIPPPEPSSLSCLSEKRWTHFSL